jgi:hypothetical protein
MRIRQARSSPNAKRSGAPTTGSGVLSSPSRRSGPAFASTLLDAAERSRCNQSVLDPASITRTSLPSCPRINSALGTPARSRRASSGWMRLRRRRAGIARRVCRTMRRRNISARIAAKARESGRRRHPLARDRIAASRLVRKPFGYRWRIRYAARAAKRDVRLGARGRLLSQAEIRSRFRAAAIAVFCKRVLASPR